MPTEYGKILLQQIEQQRRQRLQQRAEERGIPIPPDDQLQPVQSGTPIRPAGWMAQASKSGRSTGYPPQEAEVKSQDGNFPDAPTEGKNSNVHPKTTQEGVDMASALQSLAALAPLIARQPPYFAPCSDGISTASIPSIVPAPLIHQQPLLLQPTALLHPSLYPLGPHQPLGPQQLPYLSQQQDESTLQEPPPSNAVSVKEYSEGRENLNHTNESPGGALLSFSEAEPGQQRLKDAKKKYQADLLKQMRERAAEREAEKSRRKREDEEERIRLNREIEQERLAKEEEDAWQLARSKQLAEANVAAAGPPKQRQAYQAPNEPLDNSLGSRHGLTGSKRIMRDQEYADQPLRENTISVPSETKLQQDSESEPRGRETLYDRFVQQVPATGAEAERCLLLGLEALQAEVRMQTEEMRYLKNQQRRVLQHIHQGTVFRSACCERQCCPTDAGDFCDAHPAAHSRNTAINTKMTGEQHTLQAQYAFVTTVLKNAGISDPEDVMRRLAESGAIPMNCNPACPGVVSLDRVPCQYNNNAAPCRPGQLVEGPTTCEGQKYGGPQFNSTNMSLSRGLSNSSCCSLHEATPEALPQHVQGECPGGKKKGPQVEDPEDRPLPTLLKRQQQSADRQRQPESQLRNDAFRNQREDLEEQTIKAVKHTETSADKDNNEAFDTDVQGKLKSADERPCRAVGRTKLNNSSDMPADRRWRFNELWACLSHGFPPPPALGPTARVPEKDRDEPMSVTNSWCTSECESELPCQTILLPYTSDCTTPPARKRVQQCVTRQAETFSKDGWFPSSQMETLEESTAQTFMPEEHGHLGRQEKELFEAFFPREENGKSSEGINAAHERTRVMLAMRREASRLEASNGGQEKQPSALCADVDFSGSENARREDPLCSTNNQQMCRALSVDSAPLTLQQLREWDSHIRQGHSADASLKERCLHHFQEVASLAPPQEGPMRNAYLPRAHERFKSRLSWEADTALPMDEGSPVQPHVTKAEVKPLADRPFTPLRQAPLSPTNQEKHDSSADATVERSTPTPAKPPSKHVLPLQKSTRSSSVNVTNKKSRFTRAFLGAMLPRSNSRTRQ